MIAAERIEAGEAAPYSGILGKANELATATKLAPKDQMAFWRFLISVDDDIVLLPFVDPEANPSAPVWKSNLRRDRPAPPRRPPRDRRDTRARRRGDAGSCRRRVALRRIRAPDTLRIPTQVCFINDAFGHVWFKPGRRDLAQRALPSFRGRSLCGGVEDREGRDALDRLRGRVLGLPRRFRRCLRRLVDAGVRRAPPRGLGRGRWRAAARRRR